MELAGLELAISGRVQEQLREPRRLGEHRCVVAVKLVGIHAEALADYAIEPFGAQKPIISRHDAGPRDVR